MANGAGEKKTVTVDVERFVHTRNAVSFTEITTKQSSLHNDHWIALRRAWRTTSPPPPPQHPQHHIPAHKQNRTCVATRIMQSRHSHPKHD
jgi:hypothetical protein